MCPQVCTPTNMHVHWSLICRHSERRGFEPKALGGSKKTSQWVHCQASRLEQVSTINKVLKRQCSGSHATHKTTYACECLLCQPSNGVAPLPGCGGHDQVPPTSEALRAMPGPSGCSTSVELVNSHEHRVPPTPSARQTLFASASCPLLPPV